MAMLAEVVCVRQWVVDRESERGFVSILYGLDQQTIPMRHGGDLIDVIILSLRPLAFTYLVHTYRRRPRTLALARQFALLGRNVTEGAAAAWGLRAARTVPPSRPPPNPEQSPQASGPLKLN